MGEHHRTTTDPAIETEIANCAAEFSTASVPDHVRDRARYVLLDTVGVCIRGAQASYVNAVIENQDIVDLWSTTSNGGSTAFTTRTKTAPMLAAFTNASGATTLELDEGHQQSGHTAVHVIPPVLAVGEAIDASGLAVLDSIIIAYEIAARLGNLNRPMTAGLHPHGAWAAVGSAVGVAALLDLGVEQIAEAIKIAANPFIGSHWAAAMEGATVRNFYSGYACQHGMVAAMLAANGVTGLDNALIRCLFNYTATADIDAGAIRETFADVGDRYYLETGYMKVHAACRYTHAPIEAVAELSSRNTIDPDTISTITVESFDAAAMLDDPHPHNSLSAKFSIPYAVAAYIVQGSSDVPVFEPPIIFDERILHLAERVHIAVDDRYERLSQAGKWGARVTVATTDGDEYSVAIDDPRGGGDSPFTPAEIEDKFARLVSAVESEQITDQLRDDILHIERLERVSQLFAPLRRV